MCQDLERGVSRINAKTFAVLSTMKNYNESGLDSKYSGHTKEVTMESHKAWDIEKLH